MSDADFQQIEDLQASGGSDAVFDWLFDALRERKEYHKLFDAHLIRKKQSLGLSVARPTSLEDVPSDLRKEVEETYIAAARDVGQAFLADGDISSAWMYLQVIREPDAVKAAIEDLPIRQEPDEQAEEVTRIALFDRVHPLKGVERMLKSHGMCNTITSLDQAMPSLSAEQRRECAKVMVRELYDELTETVRRHVQQRIPTIEPQSDLGELVTGRDWLFEGGNYHTDVSHLNSVVRFARSLEGADDEMKLALHLCKYGHQLDEPLRYPGEPPFEDFYDAHQHFFQALLAEDPEPGLGYFRKKLADEPDEQDKPLLAYVLVDLLMRVDRLDEAVDVAASHLTKLGDDVGFSFAELCDEAKRFDRLQQVCKEQDDLVGYAAALTRSSAGDSDS